MTTGEDAAFDLRPTQEQQIAMDALARFAEEKMRPGARKADLDRQLEDGWFDEVAKLGLPLINIPASCGGAGARSVISQALVTETLAKGDMAMAVAALAPVSFVNAMIELATEEQCLKWLSPLVSEDFVAASVAMAEPGLRADLLKPETTASYSDGSWILNGSKIAVPLAQSAGMLLITATDSDSGDACAFVVEGASQGLEVRSERWMGLCAIDLASVELKDVKVPKEQRLGTPDTPCNLRRLQALGRIGTAAMATGVCQAVVDYCVPYCNERVAFGEPISHRQAVAFKLADAATETECMRLMMWRAASMADRENPDECERLACLAHAFAAEHGMNIGNDGVQLLGGHGFTREHPVELWYRNLRSVRTLQSVAIL